MKLRWRLAVCAASLLCATHAMAETRVTLKSAQNSTSYYAMTVQLGEIIRQDSNGEILPTIEESQGSVQNVKEGAKRPGNFVFTTPPNLLADAKAGKKPFEGETGYDAIRTLFPMPFVTVHLVVRTDAGVSDVTELTGKDFVMGGKGTFCEGRTNTILGLLGVADKVNKIDVELKAAGDAMKNRKIAGFATCSSHPIPSVQEMAVGGGVNVLSFTPEQRKTILAADPQSGPVTIAAGLYKGVDKPVETVGMPVGAYATSRMDDATAYAIVKAFWKFRAELAGKFPWWAGVAPEQVQLLGEKLHPGAARYYKEAGVPIPASMQ
ncbi:MAG: TAXI family TRAP transporter solute-binding subunit [Alphaproteobacteria bacterium]|nr:TAXI family TRAP transporter solute-binding subunit [Alphaproteobacteria bacterium]